MTTTEKRKAQYRVASKNNRAKQREAGKIWFARWLSPELIAQIKELIANYKG